MSELKSRPPSKQKSDLDSFLSGAGGKKDVSSASQTLNVYHPWEEAGVREDVTKVYNLRLPEPYFLKLKYIADNTPASMQTFCLDVLQAAIDKKIEELTK
jgi:hypothetical protein